jgi:hypothetical protein
MSNMDYKPLHFIGSSIEVQFDKEPLHKKKPGCPDRFVWDGQVIDVVEKVGEWHDYSRTGHMTHNMRAANMAKALRRGSWGVGRFYFRVQTETGQIFDLYYDRAPKDASDRQGSWFLYREMKKTEDR